MDVEKFINLVKSNPILYDRRHKCYQNVGRKAKVWENIAREMNEPSEVLRVKWKGLKDGYTKFQKQAKDDTPGPKAFSKWCWAEYLKFLDNCSKPHTPSISNDNRESLDDSSVEFPLPCQSVSTTRTTSPPLDTEMLFLDSSEVLQKDILAESIPRSFIQTTSAVQSLHLSDTPHRRRSSSKRSYGTISADDGERIHLTREKRAKSSDAIDLLFKSYAETFKSFSVRKQVSLKVQLAKIFADAEIDEMQGTSIVFSSAGDESGHDYAREKGNPLINATSQNDVETYEVLQLEEFPSMKHSPASNRSSD